jgi:PadR family transcriptional regulator, regulatory protein AphA
MSLRYGLLDLLAGEPQSGYDLSQHFAISMGNVWPAQHSQIYPELAKLAADGLITQTGGGPRGRKVYQTTPEGIEALRTWMRDSEPDYSVRFEALLRIFCLWVLPLDEALAYLERDRAEYARHLAQMEVAVVEVDWSADQTTRAGRLAIEFGRRFYTELIGWIDWAADQTWSLRICSRADRYSVATWSTRLSSTHSRPRERSPFAAFSTTPGSTLFAMRCRRSSRTLTTPRSG